MGQRGKNFFFLHFYEFSRISSQLRHTFFFENCERSEQDASKLVWLIVSKSQKISFSTIILFFRIVYAVKDCDPCGALLFWWQIGEKKRIVKLITIFIQMLLSLAPISAYIWFGVRSFCQFLHSLIASPSLKVIFLQCTLLILTDLFSEKKIELSVYVYIMTSSFINEVCPIVE